MSAPGSLIGGRYRLQRLIAAGGMGLVWQADDEVLRRTVAVKQLRIPVGAAPEAAELAEQRALREARITARLHHPNAVPVFDVVEHDGAPHIVMQYVPSEPLSAVLRREGALPVAEVARIGAEVAAALQAAHGLGIVHRDVKPANILIAQPGGVAMLTDFGISHAADDGAITATGLLSGTPAYLAPEVALGEDSTTASDVYSLGSTLYAAVEGRPPFGQDANAVALLHRVAAGAFPAPERSGPLGPLLMRLMDPDPAERPSMAEAARVLGEVTAAIARRDVAPAAAAGDETIADGWTPTLLVPVATRDEEEDEAAATVLVAAPAEAPVPERRRRRLLPWLVGAAAVLVIALVGFGLLRGAPPAPAAPPPTTPVSAAPSTPSATPSATPSLTPTPTPTTPSTPSTAPSTSGQQAPGPANGGKPGKGKGKDKPGKGNGKGKGKGNGKG
ncbi:serine/threonine-protein kinase [Amnibacterium endophyticum]|uniref:non-specific serine/threonine protein kinase n=1 Tax=Amnibacterium endophyticum TaxID=2109337 RepID=A0ABW4LIS6_9MICO